MYIIVVDMTNGRQVTKVIMDNGLSFVHVWSRFKSPSQSRSPCFTCQHNKINTRNAEPNPRNHLIHTNFKRFE